MVGREDLNRPAEPEVEAKTIDPRGVRMLLLRRLIVGQTIGLGLLIAMIVAAGMLIPGSRLLYLLLLAGAVEAISLVSYWLVRRDHYRAAGYLFLFGTVLGITVNVSIRGYQDPSAVYYFWPIAGAASALGTRDGVVVAVFSAITYLAIALAQRLGYQTPAIPYNPETEGLLLVGSHLLMFFLIGLVSMVSGQSLNHALDRAREVLGRWRELSQVLEQRVAERTRDLERRAVQLEAAAEVAREATAIRDVGELLDRAVHLISDRFGFYHAGIFLVDDRGEYAVLRAASSEGGQRMLARGHRLRVGQEGIVGYVVGSGRPRIALDVGEDAVFFDNPDFPETRSEMAVPLRVGERVIGALDVQSRGPAAFDEQDAVVLQTLADQLAVAIENTRLLGEMERALREVERVYGRYTRESWQGVSPVSGPFRGYRYRHVGVEPVEEESPEARRAMEEGQPIVATPEGEGGAAIVAVPMKLRGQVVGVLNLRFEGGKVDPDTVAMVKEVANRLALALENARLLEETRERATWERRLSTVAARIRAEAEIDAILERALEEMGRVLGAERAFVQLSGEFGVPAAQGGDGRSVREVV